MDRLRRSVVVGLRTVVLLTLVVMLAGPRTVREHDNMTVIGVLDLSGSVKRFAQLPPVPDMGRMERQEGLCGQGGSNVRAWEEGWKEPAIGSVDREKLNQLGSSIAVGHPFAATGARIVTTLANEMKRRDARYGLVSICAAGAQASAMILERS